MKKFAGSRLFRLLLFIFLPLLMVFVLAGAYTGSLYSFGGLYSMEKIFISREKYKIKSDYKISLDIGSANLTLLRSKDERLRVYLKAPEQTPAENRFTAENKGKLLQITDLAPENGGEVRLPFTKGSWGREFWVYLPENFAGSLDITQKYGNLQTEFPLSLESFKLTCGGGDVFISKLKAVRTEINSQAGMLVISSLTGAGNISAGKGRVTLGIKNISGDLQVRSDNNLEIRLLLPTPYRLSAAAEKLRISESITGTKNTQNPFARNFGENPTHSIDLISGSRISVTD